MNNPRITVVRGVECVAAEMYNVRALAKDLGKRYGICALCPADIDGNINDHECRKCPNGSAYAPLKYLPMLQMRGATILQEVRS